jgi:hypothetical protein
MDTKLIMCLYVIILTKKNFKNTLALIIENHLCLTNISPPHFSLKGQFQIIPKFFTFYIIRPITFYYHSKKKKKNTKQTSDNTTSRLALGTETPVVLCTLIFDKKWRPTVM